MHLKEIRREYSYAELHEKDIAKIPMQQFSKWLEEAINSRIEDPTAMSLASIGPDGFPQSRIVLLKDFGETGFTFFTNYTSEKALAIANNNKVGLHFYWPQHNRQVRILGHAKKTDPETSKKYFQSRPQESQLAAIVSQQSIVIASRRSLESKFQKLNDSLGDKQPDYPNNWGGYRVKPIYYEFWQGRENRLHDRIVYQQNKTKWDIFRLAP